MRPALTFAFIGYVFNNIKATKIKRLIQQPCFGRRFCFRERRKTGTAG